MARPPPINPDKSSSAVLLDLLHLRQISLPKIFVWFYSNIKYISFQHNDASPVHFLSPEITAMCLFLTDTSVVSIFQVANFNTTDFYSI
jgi:hypothetical protein